MDLAAFSLYCKSCPKLKREIRRGDVCALVNIVQITANNIFFVSLMALALFPQQQLNVVYLNREFIILLLLHTKILQFEREKTALSAELLSCLN